MINPEKKLGMVDSFNLAEYIAYKCGDMSHLKLQKLLYYVQAYHLAYFGEPIIEDQFQAWVHGPVSRKLFDKLKDKAMLHTQLGFAPDETNPDPDALLRKKLTIEQYEWINEILKEFSPLSGTELESLSHAETPWIEARKGYGPAERCERTISEDSMRTYYRAQIYTDDEA